MVGLEAAAFFLSFLLRLSVPGLELNESGKLQKLFLSLSEFRKDTNAISDQEDFPVADAAMQNVDHIKLPEWSVHIRYV